jgi:hypothetical protein
MVRPFDAAWSIIKQYDVNSYRGQRTLGREGRMALRDDAMAGANAFHQARIDAMRNLPDPRDSRGAFSQPGGEPFNPFVEQAPVAAAPRPIDTDVPLGSTGQTMPLSAGKPREMRRGERAPTTPRPGFRTREAMPLTDYHFGE